MRLIDADVLKQHIDKLPALPDGNFAGNHSALKALINMQPTIEPSVRPQEPKTGHWIKVTNGRGGHECDLCHEYAPSYQSGKEYLTNYCPNCGAKMIEPQESEKTE